MCRLLALLGFAGAGLLAYRRWRGGGRERLEVYFDDGSFLTLVEGSPEADRLLRLARRARAAVHAA